MDKIYKISGNFRQNGIWSSPDPSFEGEIVVDPEGNFYGYCNELYDSDAPEINRTRYLVGYYGSNDCMGEGIAFYKLSNLDIQSPLLYVKEDLYTENLCHWSSLQYCLVDVDTCCGPGIAYAPAFIRVDEAEIRLKRARYSKAAAERIKAKYEEIDQTIALNKFLLDNTEYCELIIGNYKGDE